MSLERRIETAIAGIEAAAFGPLAWDEALRVIATATGSRFGQLLAVGGPHEPVFNRLPDMDLDLPQAWAEVGGHHPAVNSRVRIGASAPPMQVLDETDFTTETAVRLSPPMSAWLSCAAALRAISKPKRALRARLMAPPGMKTSPPPLRAGPPAELQNAGG